MTGIGALPGTARGRGLPARLAQLVLGLAVCTVAIWLSLQVGLGLSPWDVLHQGLATTLRTSFGRVVIGVGLVVLGAAGLLGARPGAGTVLNILVIGTGLDLLLAAPWLDGLVSAPLLTRLAVLLCGVALLGVGGALYIGAHLGAGPRDSLMVALHARCRVPIGAARALVEVSALLGGVLLGGSVGSGTAVIALASGPAVHLAFRVLRQTPRPLPDTGSAPAAPGPGTR